MRTPHAHLELSSPAGRREVDLYRCAHCQGQVEAKGPKGWCHQCAELICVTCAKDGRCTPLEARLEAAEMREAFLRALGTRG